VFFAAAGFLVAMIATFFVAEQRANAGADAGWTALLWTLPFAAAALGVAAFAWLHR